MIAFKQFNLPQARGWAVSAWKLYVSLYLNSKGGVHGTISIGIHIWEFSLGFSQWDKQ